MPKRKTSTWKRPESSTFIKTYRYEVSKGEFIAEVISRCLAFAEEKDTEVITLHNGALLVIRPGDNPDKIYKEWETRIGNNDNIL